jgi:hypothetical protein
VDFIVQLTDLEEESLRSQNATFNAGRTENVPCSHSLSVVLTDAMKPNIASHVNINNVIV